MLSMVTIAGRDDLYFCSWHLADKPTAPAFVRFWTIADKGRFLARGGLSAYDPKQTSKGRRSRLQSSIAITCVQQ